MAQQSWGQDDEVISAVPATGQGVVIPSAPKDMAAESRANTGTQINLSSEARQGREEVRKAVLDLQSRYRSDENVKKYEGALPNYVAALKTQPTGSGDLALVYHFAKTVDPTSTVGTGDMENINSTDARLPAMAQNALRQLRLSDGKFTDEAREGLRAELKSILEQRRQAYEVSRQMYAETAQAPEFGVNPELVIGKAPFGQKFEEEINNYWSKRPQTQGEQLAITGGERFSTEQDKAIAAAVNSAFAAGADVQGLVDAATQAGANVTAEDVANFQAAIEARAKGQPATFNTRQSGTRSPMAQAAGEALMTPAGTFATGAVNAAGLGLLSQFAGDQVQGLEALNPVSGVAGELVGSALGTAGIGRAAGGALNLAAPGLAARLAGGGTAGAIGREVAKDVAYGGIYGANTGEGALTGAALGAAGSLGGQAVGAGIRRAAPVVGRMLGRDSGELMPPVDTGLPPAGGGVPPAGGAPMGGGETFQVFRGVSPSGPNDFGVAGKGEYASGRRSAAEAYAKGGKVVEKSITLQNPLKLDYDQLNALQTQLFGKPLTGFEKTESEAFDQWLRSNGYDGVVLFDKEISATVPEEVVKLAPMQAADEPFAPVTFRSTDGGSMGTSLETQRYAQAEGLAVPIELTRGEATRDPTQLAFEKEQILGALGGPLRNRAKESNMRALGNFERMVDITGAETTDIATAGSPVIKALSDGYKNMKTKVNVAYKRAEQAPEAQEPVSYTDLQSYIAGQDEATKDIAPVLKSVAQQLSKNDPDGTGQITVATMENIRKLINRNAQAGTPSSVYAGEMKGIIDGLTEGKGGALYEQARKLRREQARKFESREVVARLVSNIKKLDDPKVAANEVFKKSILNENPADIKFLRQTLRTLGPDGRQAWKELEGATIRHLEDAATKGARLGEDNNPVVAAGQFKKAVDTLDKDGRLDVIFNPKMAQQVRDLRDVIMYVNTVPPGTSINNSGTARTLMAMLGLSTESGANAGLSYWLTGTALPVPVVTGLKIMRQASKDAEIKKKIARSLLPRGEQ